jgi:hypothetical protein
MENNAGLEKEFCSKTNVFWGKQRYAIALKYIDLRSSAVRLFPKSEQLPEDGQVRPKRVTINGDFNFILN